MPDGNIHIFIREKWALKKNVIPKCDFINNDSVKNYNFNKNNANINSDKENNFDKINDNNSLKLINENVTEVNLYI